MSNIATIDDIVKSLQDDYLEVRVDEWKGKVKIRKFSNTDLEYLDNLHNNYITSKSKNKEEIRKMQEELLVGIMKYVRGKDGYPILDIDKSLEPWLCNTNFSIVLNLYFIIRSYTMGIGELNDKDLEGLDMIDETKPLNVFKEESEFFSLYVKDWDTYIKTRKMKSYELLAISNILADVLEDDKTNKTQYKNKQDLFVKEINNFILGEDNKPIVQKLTDFYIFDNYKNFVAIKNIFFKLLLLSQGWTIEEVNKVIDDITNDKQKNHKEAIDLLNEMDDYADYYLKKIKEMDDEELEKIGEKLKEIELKDDENVRTN